MVVRRELEVIDPLDESWISESYDYNNKMPSKPQSISPLCIINCLIIESHEMETTEPQRRVYTHLVVESHFVVILPPHTDRNHNHPWRRNGLGCNR